MCQIRVSGVITKRNRASRIYLLSKNLLGSLGDLSVHAGTTDLTQEFDNSDFRTQSAPDRGLYR